MYVLLQYDDSRKVVFVDKFSDIVNKARECFELNKGNVLIVQKYDEEWNEYIDCDSFAQINTGDKLKIILNQTCRSDDGQDTSLNDSTKRDLPKEKVRQVFKGQKKIKLSTKGEMILEPLQEQNIVNLQAQTEHESIQRGQIYQRPEHLLKPYEKAINAASEELVTMNPSLIFDRSALFEQARQNVRECGYVFKKGFSRSKHNQTEPPSSKPKNTLSDDRKTRILKITEQLQVINDQIVVKEKRKLKAEQVKDYQLCDRLLNEKKQLLSEKQTLESEMKLLQRKEHKSACYYSKKTKVNSTTDLKKPNNRIKGQTSLHSFCTSSISQEHMSLPQQIDLDNYPEQSPSLNVNINQAHSINADFQKSVPCPQKSSSVRDITNSQNFSFVNVASCPHPTPSQHSQPLINDQPQQSIPIIANNCLKQNPFAHTSHPQQQNISFIADNISQPNSSVTININPQQGLPVQKNSHTQQTLSFSDDDCNRVNDESKPIGEMSSKDF
ncbi:ngfi-a-binding 1-like [Paramuricea clavata]|uniref:Ngfi-a-binding 1-like n=1 Tax=Paramuricea clavata TaxID=317549 RepID=A0A7D9DY18_PARCT|nr:ngfi-a-binding 1-like [Paramuricea clavata]